MTLEAALTLPAFAAALLLFTVLIRIVTVETALQTVAAESAKQLALIWVPFEEQLRQAGSAAGEPGDGQPALIHESVRPLLAGLDVWKHLAEDAMQKALSEALTPVVRAQVPDDWRDRLIRPDRLRVEEVAIPHVNDPQLRFGFVLVYEMPVTLPFFRRTVEIRKSAHERVWFGR